MRCLNCGKKGIPLKTEICPQCGVHIPSLHRDLLATGTILDNKYRIDYPLGQGGFGITYRAMHAYTEQIVAIKEFYPREHALRDTTTGNLTILSASKEAYDRAKGRFIREGKTLAKLNHPNIVRVQDFFEARGTAYLVMEYLDGHTLKKEIERQPEKKFAPTRVKEIADSLVSALTTAHAAEIYHLDIKPDNTLITQTGRIVLIDFGAARAGLSSPTTQAFTVDYAPPEVISAGTQVGAYSDIFELSMMLYEMLKGQKAPNALDRLMKDNLSLTELPESFISLLSSGLKIQAENRPQNIKTWWEGGTKNILIDRPKITEIKSTNFQQGGNNIPTLKPEEKTPVKIANKLQPGVIILGGLAALGITVGGISYYRMLTKPLIATDDIPSSDTSVKEIENNSQPTKAEAEKYYKLGKEDYDSRNYDRAIENLTKAIAIDSNYLDAYNYRGNAYYSLSNYQKALQDYNKAIDINPNLAYIYYNRGNVYRQLGNHQKSLENFERSIELDSNDANTYNNRGWAYYSLGNNQKAIADYTKAIEINPNYTRAYNNRGDAYYNSGNNQKALADYTKAIETSSNNDSYAYYRRGLVYHDLGNYQKALEDYTIAIKINPDYENAYYSRAVAYNSLGNKQKAIENYNKAIEINPNYAAAYNNRGTVYYSLGEQEKALEDYNKAIVNNSEYSLAYYNRGIIYHNLGNYRKAIADYNKAIELNPNYGDAYYNIGLVYKDSRQKEKAIAAWEKAAEIYQKQNRTKDYQDAINLIGQNQ